MTDDYQKLLEANYPECPFTDQDLTDGMYESEAGEAEREHCGSDKEQPCRGRIEADIDDTYDELVHTYDMMISRSYILQTFVQEDINSNKLGISDLAAAVADRITMDSISERYEIIGELNYVPTVDQELATTLDYLGCDGALAGLGLGGDGSYSREIPF